jgi:hypothetical protein
MMTEKELLHIAIKACDYFRIRDHLWPKRIFYDTKPSWADESEFGCICEDYDLRNLIWINKERCQMREIHPVRVLMHELSHVYWDFDQKHKNYSEATAEEHERWWFDMWEGEIF